MSLPLLLLALAPQATLQSESFVFAPRDNTPVSTPNSQRTRITGEQLRATQQRSLPRALAAASGVWMQATNLGGGSAFIRGLTGNQILIMVDGVRLNDSTTRFGPNQLLNTIDPAIIESVEILRGPASVLYGSDAIGGAILIHTRRSQPGQDMVSPTLDVKADSAYEGGTITPALAWSNATDGLLFVGSLYNFEDIRTGAGFKPPTGYDGHSAFAAWSRDLGDQRSMSLSVWQHRDNDVPRTDKLYAGFGQTNPSNDRYDFTVQDRKQALFSYSDEDMDSSLADRMQLRFSVRSYDEQRDKVKFGSTTSTRERDETESIGLAGDWTKLVADDHLVTWGFDLDFDQVDATRRDTDGVGAVTIKDGQFAPNAEYMAFGAFIQDEMLGFETFDVTAGLRFSTYDFSFDGFSSGPSESGDFSAITASLQAARDLAEGHRVSATLAQGFRAPNLDDLAKDGDFGGGTELHNVDLDPEQSLTAELAYSFAKGGLRLDAAIFGTEVRDVIGRQLTNAGTAALGDETYTRANAGELTLWGFEIDGDLRMGDESPYAMDFGLAFVRGRQHDDTVNVLTSTAPFDGVEWRRVPPLNGHVGLTWAPHGDMTSTTPGTGRIGFDSARLGLDFAAGQDRLHPGDVSDARISPNGTAGWGRVDLDLTGPFGGASSWSFGLHNIFDAAYRVHGSGFDAPGASVVLGVHWAP